MIKHSLENTIIESIDLHKKIFHISSDINKVIKKFIKQLKTEERFIFVEMEGRLRMRSI